MRGAATMPAFTTRRTATEPREAAARSGVARGPSPAARNDKFFVTPSGCEAPRPCRLSRLAERRPSRAKLRRGVELLAAPRLRLGMTNFLSRRADARRRDHAGFHDSPNGDRAARSCGEEWSCSRPLACGSE